MKDVFGILRSREPVDVVIRFYGFEACLAGERLWHESQKIERFDDNSIIISLHVRGLEEVKRWVLSSGKDAEILEPEWLRKEMAEEFHKALQRYDSEAD